MRDSLESADAILGHRSIQALTVAFVVSAIFRLALPTVASAQLSVHRPTGRVAPAPLSLIDSGQELGRSSSWKVSLADADNDGDLDAFVSNWHGENSEDGKLWLNAGDGNFDESSQQFPASFTGMKTGDLDADGDVDLWFCEHLLAGQAEGRVWLNNGHGVFTATDQHFLTGNSALGDVDGDGDIDVMVANNSVGVRVYLNDGQAVFSQGRDLNVRVPENIAVADLDGDGDLDAYVARLCNDQLENLPDRIWFNDGHGLFVDSGQGIGAHMGIDVALGDVDGDGDPDALVGNNHDPPTSSNPPEPFKLYINDGNGIFSDSGQVLGSSRQGGVALADMDGDRDLDAVLFDRDHMAESGPNRVLLNNGRGRFADWGLNFGDSVTASGGVGDLDGDGDLDVFTANVGIDGTVPNQVWINTPTR